MKIIRIFFVFALLLSVVFSQNASAVETKISIPQKYGVIVPDPEDEHTMFGTYTSYGREQVEEEILKYVNEFRVAEGKCEMKMATGKSREFARGRADQLVTNFEHNTAERRALATELEFGYYEPERPETILLIENDELDNRMIETGRILPAYYEPCGGEAIGQTTTGDIKGLVESLHNSEGHWSYIGNANNDYVAIGVTLEFGFLYVCWISLNSELVEQYD